MLGELLLVFFNKLNCIKLVILIINRAVFAMSLLAEEKDEKLQFMVFCV